MKNQKFAEATKHQVDDVWKLTDHHSEFVLEALHALYDSIANRARIAETMHNKDLATTVACHYQIQQTIYLTPLRFFLEVLTKDPSIAIRSSAKAILCHEGYLRFDDKEAELMKLTYEVIEQAPEDAKTLFTELAESELIKRAYQLWANSGCSIPFDNPKTIPVTIL